MNIAYLSWVFSKGSSVSWQAWRLFDTGHHFDHIAHKNCTDLRGLPWCTLADYVHFSLNVRPNNTRCSSSLLFRHTGRQTGVGVDFMLKLCLCLVSDQSRGPGPGARVVLASSFGQKSTCSSQMLSEPPANNSERMATMAKQGRAALECEPT